MSVRRPTGPLSPRPDLPLSPGASLGPYTVLRLRGEWRIGHAYAVRDGDGAEWLALSVRLKAGRQARFTEWVAAEAARWPTRPHSLILPRAGGALGPDRGYLVLDAFGGESLLQRVRRRGALSEPAAARLTRQLAQAVAVAHDAGLALGGLRPTTVLLDAAGPRLLSLGLRRGLAALLAEPPSPPARFQPTEADPSRAPALTEDVFALGALAFYALAGTEPPRLGPDQQVAPPPSWRRDGADVAALLDPVVMRAMAPRIKDRHPTAAALVAELTAVCEVLDLPAAARALVGLAASEAGGFERVGTDPGLLFDLLHAPR